MFGLELVDCGEIGYETEEKYNEFMDSEQYEQMARAYSEIYN